MNTRPLVLDSLDKLEPLILAAVCADAATLDRKSRLSAGAGSRRIK